MHTQAQKYKASLLLMLGALIWGAAFVAQRVGADHVPHMAFTGLRFALGSLVLVPLLLADKARRRKLGAAAPQFSLKNTLLAAICGGTALAVAAALQQWGIGLSGSAGKSGFISGLYTVLVPIIGAVFLRRRLGVFTWLGAALATAGMYFLSMTGAERFGIADLVLLADALAWAVQILTVDHFNGKNTHPIGFACGQFAVCALLNLAGALAFEQIVWADIRLALVPLLYGGILSSGVGFTLQIMGQRHADPTAASIIMSMESVFAAVFGALLLDESMSAGGILGCCLMFAGIILAQLPSKATDTCTGGQ